MTGTFRLLDVDIDAASSCLLTFGTVFNFDHDEERVRYGYADESIMITSSKKTMNREVVLSRRTLPVNKEFFVILMHRLFIMISMYTSVSERIAPVTHAHGFGFLLTSKLDTARFLSIYIDSIHMSDVNSYIHRNPLLIHI